MQSGGISLPERLAFGSLNLQYAQLTASVMHPEKLPPLEDFVPEFSSEPDTPPPPRTLDDWVRALLPLAGGGV